MRRYIVGGIAAVGLLGAAPVVAPARPPPESTSPMITCTRATIGGQSKCIARGQYCARSHASDLPALRPVLHEAGRRTARYHLR